MYSSAYKELCPEFTEPPHSPDLHAFKLIDMYTRASLTKKIEKVIDSFKIPGSKLRIVIATIAFSMGVPFPDIRQIIHMECLRLSRRQRDQDKTACCQMLCILQNWKVDWKRNDIIIIEKIKILAEESVTQGV